MRRLQEIEGVRGLLALWVVVDHVLGSSGYEEGALHGVVRLLRRGDLAVDLFVLVSGFVIFYLLDDRRERYSQFVVRRFFRLYPLFAVLFVASLPMSLVSVWNLGHNPHMDAALVALSANRVSLWWSYASVNIPLHLTMLHGIVPQTLIPFAPGAFLEPAWSISLEWQFYLVAPLLFWVGARRSQASRIAVFAFCAAVFLLTPKLPAVQFGAFLPQHLELFVIGSASYFFYKGSREFRFPPDSVFLALGFLGLVLFGLSGRRLEFVPVAGWLCLLGLLCEGDASVSRRWIYRGLTNRPVVFLGQVSYSVYLAHLLVLVAAQRVLLAFAPGLSREGHFGALLLTTVVGTLGAAALLYRLVEVPGIRLGSSLARRLARDTA
jgi:peptidoglycan/LPS O-acetylase OafA/YrhL